MQSPTTLIEPVSFDDVKTQVTMLQNYAAQAGNKNVTARLSAAKLAKARFRDGAAEYLILSHDAAKDAHQAWHAAHLTRITALKLKRDVCCLVQESWKEETSALAHLQRMEITYNTAACKPTRKRAAMKSMKSMKPAVQQAPSQHAKKPLKSMKVAVQQAPSQLAQKPLKPMKVAVQQPPSQRAKELRESAKKAASARVKR